MNILQIVASPGWGGGEKYLYELSESLIERGHHIRIIGPSDHFSIELFSALAPYDAVNMKSLLNVFKLSHFLEAHQIDVIHTHIFRHAIIACLAAKLSKRRVKVVMTRHLVKKAKTSIPYMWLYRNLHCMIFVSKTALQKFSTTLPSTARPPRTEVVYNALKSPAQTSASHGHDTQESIIGFCGRLAPEKGIDTLIQAFALVENKKTQLMILGTGEQKYTDQLQKLANDLGLAPRVTFTGFIINPAKYTSQFTMAVVPSKAAESFGLVLLEYMSQGIPVISTNNGAQPEIITSGINGILINPDNPKLLADQIDILLQNDTLRQQISIAAEKRSHDFNFDKFTERIEAIYQD